MRRAAVAIATALLVVTAGCAATPGTGTPTAGGEGAGDGDGTAGGDGDGSTSGDGTASASDSGTVNFYVSDRPNDMDDFEHLNVTITTVKLHLVDAADASANESGEGNETTVATSTPNGTDADGNETATAVESDGDANVTEMPEGDMEGTDEASGDDAEESDESDGEESDEGGDGRWVTRQVNATAVDLTQLRGANATLLEQFELPAGEYDKVHMEVSEIDATLTNGEDQRVKLPSNKLQLNTEFTVENGSAVDFVYDVSVHEAGKSGKYILKPVVSESGTDVEIERVDGEENDDKSENGKKGKDGDEGKKGEKGKDSEKNETEEDAERSIRASFVGNVSAGETVTVRVTENGTAVANATVIVDDGVVGTTDADGEYVLSVPSDAEELSVTVESGDAEAELETEFEAEASTDTGDEGTGDGADGQTASA